MDSFKVRGVQNGIFFFGLPKHDVRVCHLLRRRGSSCLVRGSNDPEGEAGYDCVGGQELRIRAKEVPNPKLIEAS